MTKINSGTKPTMTWEEAVAWLRNQPDQHDLVKACFFDDPLENAALRYYNSGEWDEVRKLMKGRTGSALDIGAGRGISSFALAQDGWQVTALEPDPSELVGSGAIRELVKQTGCNINVVQEWGESLPFPKESFDLVYGRQVLHHASNLAQLCKEAERVLKPGGIFIATREHVISKKEDLSEFLESHPLQFLYGGEHAYLLEEYQSAINAAGLELTSCLNPYQNEINYYPSRMSDIKRKLVSSAFGRMSKFMPIDVIPNALIYYWGHKLKTPGRLYSFVAQKKE